VERKRFDLLASKALERIEAEVAAIDDDRLDVELAGDVLTIGFADGTRFVLNAHGAAGQIWMAAERSAWHFDWDQASERWVAARSGAELRATVMEAIGRRLGPAVAP